jgi:hypothetical protein
LARLWHFTRLHPSPTRRDISDAIFGSQIGHARPLAPTQSSPAASSDPGPALSNVAHAQWACLTRTWFNGQIWRNSPYDHPPLLTPQTPNSKRFCPVSTSSILNSTRFIVTILCWRTSRLECLLPIEGKGIFLFFQKKIGFRNICAGTIDLASCNLGLYCLTLHRAAATRTSFDTHSLSSHGIIFTASKPCHARLYLGMHIEQSYNPSL